MQVWVLNTSDAPLKASYDGVSYEFPVGRHVAVPIEAAKHIFGYPDEDKEPCLVRLGWVRMNTDLPAGFERLARFVISDRPSQDHHYQSPVVGRIPLPPSKGGGGKGTAKVA
jgi:hypothetical protein